MSAPVRTAWTPGTARAAIVSIERMRACGSGLERNLATRVPGGTVVARVGGRPRDLQRPLDPHLRVPKAVDHLQVVGQLKLVAVGSKKYIA